MHPSYVNQTPRKGDKHSRKRKTLIDIRPNAQDYIIKQYKEKAFDKIRHVYSAQKSNQSMLIA